MISAAGGKTVAVEDAGTGARDVVTSPFRASNPFRALIEEAGVDSWPLLERCLDSLGDSHARAMQEFASTEWSNFWNSLPVPARVSESLVRKNWWQENCVKVAEAYASTVKPEEGDGKTADAADNESAEKRAAPDARSQANPTRALIDDADIDSRPVLEIYFAGLGDSHARALQEFVSSEWEKFWNSLPAAAKISEDLVRKNWSRENCKEVAQIFASTRKPSTQFFFQPELAPERLANGEAVEVAKKLITRVCEADAERIRAQTQATYEASMCDVPGYLRTSLESSFRENFLQRSYYEIVQRVLDESPGRYAFTPAIAYSAVQSKEGRDKIEEACKSIGAADVPVINEEVQSKFYETCGTREQLDSWASLELQKQMWDEFLTNHYFEIVMQVMTSRCANSPVDAAVRISNQTCEDEGDAASRKRTNSSPARTAASARSGAEAPDARSAANGRPAAKEPGNVPPSGMFSSPKRRRTTNERTTSGPDKVVSVGSLHREDVKDCCPVLQAYVLHFSDLPRYANVSARGPKEAEKIAVLSVLLADGTGPIVFDAWRNLAVNALNSLVEWEKDEDDAAPICVEIRGFVVREESRHHVSPIRKISSNDQTTIQRLESPSHPNMQESCRMDAFIYTGDFATLLAKTPFVVNVTGIVTDVGGETISQNGNSMRSFRLQDSTSKSVHCMAFDRHADNPALKEGNMIVLYFATGLPGMRNNPGALWMYNESHIVLVRSGCRVPPSAGEVLLQGPANQ